MIRALWILVDHLLVMWPVTNVLLSPFDGFLDDAPESRYLVRAFAELSAEDTCLKVRPFYDSCFFPSKPANNAVAAKSRVSPT